MSTFYDELGVKKTATAQEIERAYRILARKFHPDRNPGREADAKTRFVRVQEAYEVISNPTLRGMYDETFEKDEFVTDISVERAPPVDIDIPASRWRALYHAHTVWLISTAIVLGMLTTIFFLARSGPIERSVSSGDPVPPAVDPTVRKATPSRTSGAAGKSATMLPVFTPGATAETGDEKNPRETQTLGSLTPLPKGDTAQAATPEESIRWTVPDDDALDAARKYIAELYLRDLDGSVADVSDSANGGNKTQDVAAREQLRRQKSQLAAKLLSVAIDTPSDPPVRFVLCDMSAELAAQVGDCKTAWKALAEMGRRFEIDVLPKKEAAMKQASSWAVSASDHKGVGRYWLALALDALAEDLYDEAQTFLANATREVDFAPDKLWQKILQESALQLREMMAAYQKAHPFEERLSRDPRDFEAAQQWGKYLCLYKNNWADGLPLWATPFNQGPPKVADDDAQSPAGPGNQIGLAIAWHEAAEQERDSLPKRAMNLRAALWYSRAVPKLPAYLQPATAVRVQELVNELSPVRAGETVNLLATIEPEADTISGAWRQAGSELQSSRQAGRLVIPVAISHDGSYELEVEFAQLGSSFHGGEFLIFPTGDADWSITLQSRGASTASGAALRARYHGSGVAGGGSAPLGELLPNRLHKFKVAVELIANETAKIRCELDGKACFDGQEPLPKLSFAEFSRLQEGAIILCTNVDQPSDSTVYHAIRLRLKSGSAHPLSNVAGFKLGLVEAGGTKRQNAIHSTADQQSAPETCTTDVDLFDPLVGVQAPAFSFMPIELDDPLLR